MAIAHDPGGYLSGLRLFELGKLDPWVKWFAEVAERAASTTHQIIDRTSALLARWEQATTDLRTDHSAHTLLPHLPAHPLLSAGDVAQLLGTSERSARTALSALASRGILSPIDVPSSTPRSPPPPVHRPRPAPPLGCLVAAAGQTSLLLEGSRVESTSGVRFKRVEIMSGNRRWHPRGCVGDGVGGGLWCGGCYGGRADGR